ncbi:hypothetical protein L3Q82_004094 [Scortum barcoo]|uniref:Uncharacterized protein n=1 Tax=Scortum barcoo TaxID=214431 RepID=A0ACB8X6S2_9TELE|nr:hypothetical protein L3Q82_004094 [Scortum barcoo]
MFSASIVDAAVRNCGRKVSGACSVWRQPPNPVVDTGRDAIKLKESYRAMLACRTPDAADRYRQAKQAAALGCPGGKNSFGPGRSLVRPWRKTVSLEEILASEGESSTLFTVRCGEPLTSTGDIVRRWKEYFEDLLNPTDTCLPLRKRRLRTLRWTRPPPKPKSLR